jgi:hypothetical protein
MHYPKINVEKHDRFWIVRDDLHPGGTKQIILRQWLPEFEQTHFVYVASVYGKGGAALAYACAELGFRCTLLIAQSNFVPDWIAAVEKLGTEIIWTEQMPVTKIEPLAWEYVYEQDAQYLSLGFAQERFKELLIDYARSLPFAPQEIWCPIVSGTMATALEQAFPEAALKGVAVVKHHEYAGEAQIYSAAEKFVRGAAIPPPYPSWPFSDAKVWRFAKKFGADDALIWNSNA